MLEFVDYICMFTCLELTLVALSNHVFVGGVFKICFHKPKLLNYVRIYKLRKNVTNQVAGNRWSAEKTIKLQINKVSQS